MMLYLTAQAMDSDMKELVGFYALQEGLKKLTHLKPQIHLSSDDFQRITKNGELCNGKGQLDQRNFELMMREEVNKFLQSRIAQAYEDCTQNQDLETAATLGGLKLLTKREALADAATHDVILSKVQAAMTTNLVGIVDSVKSSVHGALCTALHGIRQELRSELRGLRAELQSVKAGIHEARLQAKQPPVIIQPVDRDPFPSRHRRAFLTLNRRRRPADVLPLVADPRDHFDSNSIFGAGVSSISSATTGLELRAAVPSAQLVQDAPITGNSKSRGIPSQTSPSIRWSALAKSASFAEMLQASMKDSGMGFFCDAGLRLSRRADGHRMANTSEFILISICEDEAVDFAAIENRSTVDNDFSHIMGGNLEYIKSSIPDDIDLSENVFNNTIQHSKATIQSCKCDGECIPTEVSISDSSFDTVHTLETTSESLSHGIACSKPCNWCNGLSHRDGPWTSKSSTVLDSDEYLTSALGKKEVQICSSVSNGATGRVPRTCNVLCRLAAGGGNGSYFPDSSINDDLHYNVQKYFYQCSSVTGLL
jgi:hypothetical protein